MKETYLEVTFRQGKPIAAYLYLQRQPGEKSYRTSTANPGLVIDFNRSGRPIGIEITAPEKVTVTTLNKVLNSLGLPLVSRSDLAPLQAA
jgi:hypothetical protein